MSRFGQPSRQLEPMTTQTSLRTTLAERTKGQSGRNAKPDEMMRFGSGERRVLQDMLHSQRHALKHAKDVTPQDTHTRRTGLGFRR